MFKKLSSDFATKDDIILSESLQTNILHLIAVKDEFKCYFPKLKGDKLNLIEPIQIIS